MKLEEVMTSNPATCQEDDTLATASRAMWENDCGAIPVVARSGRPIGMITDRDICMATMLRDSRPSEVRVADAMSSELSFCVTTDEVGVALETMREHRIRRVPVVDAEQQLVGIVSMNDLVLAARAKPGKLGAPAHASVVSALKGVCAHRILPVSA